MMETGLGAAVVLDSGELGTLSLSFLLLSAHSFFLFLFLTFGTFKSFG